MKNLIIAFVAVIVLASCSTLKDASGSTPIEYQSYYEPIGMYDYILLSGFERRRLISQMSYFERRWLMSQMSHHHHYVRGRYVSEVLPKRSTRQISANPLIGGEIKSKLLHN